MPGSHRILVVDDNAVTRYSVRRVLEHHQFVVEEAGTGTDGLAKLATHAFAAVVLDVNLPDMSGFDIVRSLRAAPRTALLPVVHVSAASIATGDMATGLDAGADAYLIHPVDPSVLVATLRTLLRARNAEDALRISEARFREIFEHISAPIAVVDANLHTHEANAAFQRLIGSATPGDAIQAAGLDQATTVHALTTALAQRARWSGTLSIIRDGKLCETEWRVSPYREPDLGLLLVEDVTEQRLREREQRQELDTATTELAHQIAERQRTEIQLLQAQKMEALGNLTGGIAHDFNNLLTSIISGLDMIQLAVESNRIERVPRLAEIATGSAHRAAALTQRMLAFARKQSLDAQAFDINARVRSLEDMLHRSIGENIVLELDLAQTPLVAVADANQLENVVLNLVINARDALKGKGTIRIQSAAYTARNDPELDDGDYVAVNVIDNGSGIEPAILNQVFEPFFTTKPIGEGTGLGLSMTYGFARQSGGTARITSTVGRGPWYHGGLAVAARAHRKRGGAGTAAQIAASSSRAHPAGGRHRCGAHDGERGAQRCRLPRDRSRKCQWRTGATACRGGDRSGGVGCGPARHERARHGRCGARAAARLADPVHHRLRRKRSHAAGISGRRHGLAAQAFQPQRSAQHGRADA